MRGNNICKNAYEGIICINGYCEVKVVSNEKSYMYRLDTPNKCLIIEPYEWHMIVNFKRNSVLLAFSNKKYNELEMY